MAIACSAALAGADPRLDLAGMSPGQTPRQAASGFLHALPTLALNVEEGASPNTPSDALASDCSPIGPSAWACKAQFNGAAPDPAATEAELQYQGAGAASDRTLARARVAMNWEAPLARGWEAFKAKRPKPDSVGKIPTRMALEAFAGSPLALAKATPAASFMAARWRGYADDGSATELTAIAALDKQGRLLALLSESALIGWGAKMREAASFKAAPTLP